MHEIWKDIKGYEGLYQVSNHGRVKSVGRTVERSNGRKLPIKEKIMVPSNNGHGYLILKLSRHNRFITSKVHRLVAEAFIPNPENKSQVNHIDGNKQNNHVSNLEWATPWENQMHSINTGLKTFKFGEKHPMAKLSEREVVIIKILHTEYNIPSRKLALLFGISKTQVLDISRANVWKHIV